MKIRFRIEHTDYACMTELVISINCTPVEMSLLGADLNAMDIDNRNEATKQLIEAVNIMSGKKDFVYETKNKT